MFDSTVDQGAEPATGSQESAIENMEDPGRQRATQEGIGRDLEIHGFFLGGGWVGWDEWREILLLGLYPKGKSAGYFLASLKYQIFTPTSDFQIFISI